MKELSIFVDESGDFGEYNRRTPYYIISMVLHDQDIDITEDLKILENELHFEICETAEKIYIGSDFPDEFCHSNDTHGLKGANTKAKANIAPAIGELIQIACEKEHYPDYNNKHGMKAQYGWYRYITRFGIPVYDEHGNLERYNIFSARMLVRCDADGKLYLYDLVRTKKETSKPHEQ